MSNRDQIFEARRIGTLKRLHEFTEVCKQKLEDSWEESIGDHGCIYAVGSAGRMETTSHSDLDVFLVDMDVEYGSEKHSLNGTILKSAVIRSFRAMSLPDPSNGGDFLQLHSAKELVRQIGQQTDDPKNTFTARMLLLLESYPMIGKSVYLNVVDEVLTSYWKDYKGHEHNYVPILLINDIVRYWRMLLLNYVAMNVRQTERNEVDSDRKRRLRSFKLRFARCLTCYSALAYLLSFEKPGISTGAIKEMVALCPYDRLAAVGSRTTDSAAKALIDELLDQYASFLETVDQEKSELLSEFDSDRKGTRFQQGDAFGRKMAELMLLLGARAPTLFRFMLV